MSEVENDRVAEEEEEENVTECDDPIAFISESESEADSFASLQASGWKNSPRSKQSYKPQERLSASPSSVSSVSPLPPSEAATSKMRGQAPRGSTKPTFLPSLTMGGYFSGSESDVDEGSPFDVSSNAPPLRKNRRGQRARQQIAEKKYGNKANHLKMSQAEQSKRDTGWDTRKGATEDRGARGRAGRGLSRRFDRSSDGKTQKARATGANEEVVKAGRTFGVRKGVSNEGDLHPSWEAAKKRKEQREKSSQAFVGKKITFD